MRVVSDSANDVRPLVSIIMPARNADDYIAEAIESCLSQTYSNIELIIVNDGSTDRTAEIIRSFGIEAAGNTGGIGANAARNFGLRQAKGVFVKFMDSDDILLSRAIEQQVLFARTLATNEIGYGRMLQFGSLATKRESGFYQPSLGESCLDDLLCSAVQTALPLHRLAHLLNIGGFDESLKIGQEWNMHARMAQQGVRFKPDATRVLLYRAHEDLNRISVRHKASPSFLNEKLRSIETTFGLCGNSKSPRINGRYTFEIFSVYMVARQLKFPKIMHQLNSLLISRESSFEVQWLGRRARVLYELVGHRFFFKILTAFAVLMSPRSKKAMGNSVLENLFPAKKN
jgi:glycosyltransferase involved in cell wall biosynthesis